MLPDFIKREILGELRSGLDGWARGLDTDRPPTECPASL
jgi:hypothetical protein